MYYWTITFDEKEFKQKALDYLRIGAVKVFLITDATERQIDSGNITHVLLEFFFTQRKI